MPTPEQQREYSRLCSELQRLGRAFFAELPPKTASLHLHSFDGRAKLDAYDATGRLIGHYPNDKSSNGLRESIKRLGREECSDLDGIICPL
jgi:hypothetical protein